MSGKNNNASSDLPYDRVVIEFEELKLLEQCRVATEEDNSQITEITERLRSDNGHTDLTDLHRY